MKIQSIIRPFNVPSDGEKLALAGSYGTPGASNAFVTETDPRYVGEANILRVDPDGTHGFTSIKTAIDSILDASPTNQYVVMVAPGEYTEAPFSMKSWVSLIGVSGFIATHLKTSNNAAHFITGAIASEIINFSITGPTDAGMAAIRMNAEGVIPLVLNNISIRKGYYGLLLDPAGATGMCHIHNMVNLSTNSGDINTMFRVTGYGKFASMNSGCMTGAADAVAYGWHVTGANASAVLDNCFFKMGSAVAIYQNASAAVRTNGCSFAAASKGIHIGPDGSSAVQMIGQSFLSAVTDHIDCDSATATILFSGAGDSTKFAITPGASMIGSFVDIGATHYHVIGDIRAKLTGGTEFSVGEALDVSVSTGIHDGGMVEEVAGVGNELKVDVEAGHGIIVQLHDIIPVEWNATQLTLPGAGTHYIFVNSAGTVSQDTVEPDYNDNVLLAVVSALASDIHSVLDHRIQNSQLVPSLAEYIENVIGPICGSGCVATINGGNGAKLDVDTGQFYGNLHPQTVNGSTPITFNYHYRNGVGGWTVAASGDTFDAANYDDGDGTLGAVPAGKFHRQLVFVSVKPDGTDLYHVYYAQEYYDTQQDAENGNNPPVSSLCSKYGMRVAAVVMQQGSANIVSVVDQRPFIGQSASGVTTFTDHGSLAGLADDDHPHYYNQSRGDARWALLAKGVTNGDTHNHAGGDGGQISHADLSTIGTNTHAQIDSHIAAAAPHSGHAAASHTHDHGNELSGLNDDDHPQYHNDARGDARYTPLAHASQTTYPHTRWREIVKSADETRTSTDTPAADSQLQFAMDANTKYAVRGRIFFDTSVAGDFKWRHAGPASPTLVRIRRVQVPPGAAAHDGIAVDTLFSAADITVVSNNSNGGYVEFEGIIHNGVNAGTFSINWAQNTIDAGSTTVRAGSSLFWTTA